MRRGSKCISVVIVGMSFLATMFVFVPNAANADLFIDGNWTIKNGEMYIIENETVNVSGNIIIEGDVVIAIGGRLSNGISFYGADTIRVR